MILKLYGLAFDCPKGNVREEDCPFFKIEYLSYQEKIEWINQLAFTELEVILNHHLKCTSSIN